MLVGLADYLQAFSAPDFEFGHWSPPTQDGEVMSLGYYEMSDKASAFVDRAYALCWVYDFDWMSCTGTSEGQALYHDRAAVAVASAGQLSMLLTALIRGERFGEGTLAECFDSGLLTAILRRVSVLAAREQGPHE